MYFLRVTLIGFRTFHFVSFLNVFFSFRFFFFCFVSFLTVLFSFFPFRFFLRLFFVTFLPVFFSFFFSFRFFFRFFFTFLSLQVPNKVVLRLFFYFLNDLLSVNIKK